MTARGSRAPGSTTTAARQAPAAASPVDVPVVMKHPIDLTDEELITVWNVLRTTASPYGKAYGAWMSAFFKFDAERARRGL